MTANRSEKILIYPSSLPAPAFETVMVIEDNATDMLIIGKMISNANFATKLLETNAATEALIWLIEQEDDAGKLPGVIFLDLQMPGMDGFGFLKAFDVLPPAIKSNCKIVVVSSYFDAWDKKKALDYKTVYHFLRKPLKAQDFVMLQEELKKTV